MVFPNHLKVFQDIFMYLKRKKIELCLICSVLSVTKKPYYTSQASLERGGARGHVNFT